MLAEQLNSGSWLHRATACRMLCYLRGETSNVTAPVVIFEYFRILFPNTVKLANFLSKMRLEHVIGYKFMGVDADR